MPDAPERDPALPRLQVLTLPGDAFILVLSGYSEILDPDLLADIGRDCGAKKFMVFAEHIEVG